MKNIPLPPRLLEPLAEFVKLRGGERDKLIEAIRGAKPQSIGSLAQTIAAQLGADVDRITAIMHMLANMYNSVREIEISPKEFATAVVGKAQERKYSAPAEGKWDTIAEQLSRILECDDSLGLGAKALEIMQEVEHLYCSGRILTDLRPVFGSDAARGALAAVIVHTLRIAFHEAGHLKEVYLGLTSDDLDELEELVQRARQKEKALRHTAEKANLICLDLAADEHA